MRFDWYAATVLDDVDSVALGLAEDLGATIEAGRAMYGFTSALDLRAGGSVVARVLYGGNGGHPHVWGSSDHTQGVVASVRSRWPDRHRVTRMDAAQDFDGPGTWERLYAVCLAVADDRRLKVNQAGDWHRLEDGRTLYLGGTKSAVRVRLYEKGKQLRGLAVDGGADISPDLVRLEVQVRPDGDARLQAAVGTPDEAWGYSDWSLELLRQTLDLDVDRVHIRERRESDDERAIHWLVRQYGEHLERLAAQVGGWREVGAALGREKSRQDAQKGGV